MAYGIVYSSIPGVSSIHTTAVVLIPGLACCTPRRWSSAAAAADSARDAAVSIVRTLIERLTIMTVSPLFLYGVPVDMDGPYEDPAVFVSLFSARAAPLSWLTA